MAGTYQDAALILCHSQLSGLASCALCTGIDGHCECTSHNLAVLDLFSNRPVRFRRASQTDIDIIWHDLPHLTFLCLHSSHLKVVSSYGQLNRMRRGGCKYGTVGSDTYETVRGRFLFSAREPLEPLRSRASLSESRPEEYSAGL